MAGKLIFWFSAILLGYATLGYPLLMALLARVRPRRRGAGGAVPAECAFLMAVHNQEARVAGRLANLLDCRPSDRCPIIVVCDGCSDATAEVVGRFADKGVILVEERERRGKAACLNRGFSLIEQEIVVLCDVRQSFLPSTVATLLCALGDPRVGAVSGSLEIVSSGAGAGRGLDLYWKMEKKLRQAEARFDSAVGCTGAVYAIRRKLFRPLPEDTLLDDVLVPMQVVLQGARVDFRAEAVAHDPQELNPDPERRRKRRTLAGNFQLLFRYPGWLLPWRNRLWWQLISHKYLRLGGPVFLAAHAGAAACLACRHGGFYLLEGAFQILAYGLGIAGLLLGRGRSRFLAVPAGFLLLQWTCLLGFGEWFRRSLLGKTGGSWE